MAVKKGPSGTETKVGDMWIKEAEQRNKQGQSPAQLDYTNLRNSWCLQSQDVMIVTIMSSRPLWAT